MKNLLTFPTLEKEFAEKILRDQILKSREKIGIACSGGPDSTALADLLHGLQKKWGFKVTLLHLNHNLRGKEASRDANFVKKLASSLKWRYVGGSAHVQAQAKENKKSIEEAARHARYDFLLKSAKKYQLSKILLAHTQDDQAETVLMRVIQGTGLRGLCGIRKTITLERVVFYRPLLDVTKKTLMEHLKNKKISFRKDQSNLSPRFLRNKVRLHLIPKLEKEFNPKVTSALARIPEIVEMENEILSGLEEKVWRQVVKSNRKHKEISLKASFFKCLSGLQFRILDRALKSLHRESGLDFEAWKKIRPSLSGKVPFRLTLARNIDLQIFPGKSVTLRRENRFDKGKRK